MGASLEQQVEEMDSKIRALEKHREELTSLLAKRRTFLSGDQVVEVVKNLMKRDAMFTLGLPCFNVGSAETLAIWFRTLGFDVSIDGNVAIILRRI